MSLSPLSMSPDYINIENRTKRKKHKVRSAIKIDKDFYSKQVGKAPSYFHTMQFKNPTKYRYIRFYGEGDLEKGLEYYKSRFGELNKESAYILKALKKNRLSKDYANHIGELQSTLSVYSKQKPKKQFWQRFLTMRKVVKHIDKFMEEHNDIARPK